MACRSSSERREVTLAPDLPAPSAKRSTHRREDRAYMRSRLASRPGGRAGRRAAPLRLAARLPRELSTLGFERRRFDVVVGSALHTPDLAVRHTERACGSCEPFQAELDAECFIA